MRATNHKMVKRVFPKISILGGASDEGMKPMNLRVPDGGFVDGEDAQGNLSLVDLYWIMGEHRVPCGACPHVYENS